jgi:glycine oxidase
MKYLILGQGIAGSLVAWFCEKAGLDYHVIDNNHLQSSTVIAAGLFNPFTGPRMVLTWQAEVIFPLLHHTYSEIQNTICGTWFHPMPLYRPFLTIQEQNDILAKAGQHPEFLDKEPENTSHYVNDTFGGLTARQSGYILTDEFLGHFNNYLASKDRITHLVFEEEKVQETTLNLFGNSEYHVIDCRGYMATQSPWWQHLPWLPNKGEVLEINWNGPAHFIPNRKVYAVALAPNRFKIGATYNNQFAPEEAFTNTEAAKEELITYFTAFAKGAFEVTGQHAAVRPAILGRRPIIAQHPEHPWLYILNGLGSKGISLAPYFARELVRGMLI